MTCDCDEWVWDHEAFSVPLKGDGKDWRDKGSMMAEEIKDRRVFLRLPPDLYEDIRVAARQAGVPINWFIITALDGMFGFTDRKPRPRQLG